jgi:hypothetical protein
LKKLLVVVTKTLGHGGPGVRAKQRCMRGEDEKEVCMEICATLIKLSHHLVLKKKKKKKKRIFLHNNFIGSSEDSVCLFINHERVYCHPFRRYICGNR